MSAAPVKTNPVATLASVVVGLFTRNLGVKIAALVMAVVVWFTVRQDISQLLTLSVQVKGLSAVELGREGLMPVGTLEMGVEVTFEGPRSLIDDLRKEDQPRIHVRVNPGDFVNEIRRTLVFSLDKRNVEHRYGESIEITSMKPSEIHMTVAVKEQRKLPVHRPAFDGSLGEWNLDGDLLFTPKITVSGPKDVLDDLSEIATKPIPIGELLRGNGEENRKTLKGTLDLADSLEKRLVRAGRNERVNYTATFVRNRVTEGIKVPFFVKYETLDTTVRLSVETNTTIQKTSDGLEIELQFKGRKADLDRIRELAEKEEIRAFIRAEDSEDFVDGDTEGGGIFRGNVRLEMPDDLYRRVTMTQPDPGTITVSIEPR